MANRKPAWWQLVLLVPAMFLLVGLEHHDALPGVSEMIVDGVIISLTFIGMLVWVHINEGLIEHYEVDEEGWLKGRDVVTVYEPTGNLQDEEEEGQRPEQFMSPVVPPRVRPVSRARYMRSKEHDKWDLN